MRFLKVYFNSIKSIKIYLFTNLLVGVIFATTLAVLGHIYTGYKQIKPHLDAQIVVMAYTISTFITEDFDNEKILSKLHANTAQYVNDMHHLQYDDDSSKSDLHASLDSIQFRVFDKRGTLVAQSPSAPDINPYHIPKNGFFRMQYQHSLWRVFNLHTQRGDHVIVMQPHATRLSIEKNSNNTAVIISLLTIPPLGLFIFLVIGRSLRSIHQTTNEIRQRAHNNLNPINSTNIPIEIIPLINELNSLFTRLHANFERESRFASDAAHELKTPLAAIQAHAQVASEHNTMDQIKTELLKVNKSVQRATHTVDQLLMLSRTMPDIYSKDHIAVNLPSLIRQVIAEFIPISLKQNINISFEEAQRTNPAVILGHETTLSILLANLVDNAIRYSPNNTEIIVQLNEDQHHYHLHVIDQGIGIPEALRERIFERFYRVIGNQAQGTGLGLNIVKQIAQLHKAGIQVQQPSTHRGTEFIISFPKIS